MVITEFLERNARLYGSDTALVELNPSQERDSAVQRNELGGFRQACQPFREPAPEPRTGAGGKGRYSDDELSGMAACLFRYSEGGRRSGAFEFPLFRGGD